MPNLVKKERKKQAVNLFRRDVYERKYKEYDDMTVEQINETFNGNKRIGGLYRQAMLDVLQKKLTAEALERAKNEQVNTEKTTEEHEPSTTENTDSSLQSESTTESVQETTD